MVDLDGVEPENVPECVDPEQLVFVDGGHVECKLREALAQQQLARSVAHELQDLARQIELGRVVGINAFHWSVGSSAWSVSVVKADEVQGTARCNGCGAPATAGWLGLRWCSDCLAEEQVKRQESERQR